MPSNPKTPGKTAPDSPAEGGPKAPPAPGDARRERQAQALRDNLKKRKAQQRRRESGTEGGA